MKRNILLLFVFVFAYQFVHSQSATRRDILLSDAKQMELVSRAAFSEAVIKAKKNGWPISYTSRNNSKASLIGIDNFGQPNYIISHADPLHAITISTNKLWPLGSSGLNLSGSIDLLTNKLGMWDEGGVRNSHKEINGRITQKDNVAAIDHSTHVMGIMLNSGLNPLAKGMAYNLKGALAYDWFNDASEMAAAAAAGLLISNHSYGTVAGWDYNTDSTRWEYNGRWNEKEDYKFGLYNNEAQLYDSIAYNAPNYLIVKSVGNSRGYVGPTKDASGKWYNNDSTYWRRDQKGTWYNAGLRPDSLSSNDSYETIATDGNAKNILTVGAVAGISSGYTKKEDVVMTYFSCWGPTDDGRIKPDVVADGLSVLSATANNDSSYAYYNGTSMASPGTAGALLLLDELSLKTNSKSLRSATLKALAIHTANEAGTTAGPDYKFGWGLLNTNDAAIALNNALTSNNGSSSTDLVYERTLLNNDSAIVNVVASGKSPLKATLVWTDSKGTIASTLDDPTPKLVNDLDLVITAGTNTYLPWTLNPLIPSASAQRGNNKLDNVEKVQVDSAIVGKIYSVKIKHKGTLDRGQQAYSLIISGVGGTAYCTSNATTNTGSKIDSVSLNNIQLANASLTHQYIDNSQYIVLGEPSGSLPFYLKLGSTDATNNTRFVKIFIDYNNNGIFETSETVATSTGIKNGTYSGTISLPASLTIGQTTKLRIVVNETTDATYVAACNNYAIGETQDYTFKVNNASNDIELSEIISPSSGAFKKDFQYVTIKLINNGSTTQSNIPLNLIVKKGTTVIANLNETFNGKLKALDNMLYTFQSPISIEAATSYSITATANLVSDQLIANNSISTSFVSASIPAGTAGTANSCGSTLQLNVTTPSSSANYFWYDSTSSKNPIGAGNTFSLTSTATNINLKSGYQGFVGPEKNNTLGTAGGYSHLFSGNFMNITTKSPLQLETVKLYTGYPGKIQVTLAKFGAWNAVYDTSTKALLGYNYSYAPIQTATINAGYSTPTPTFTKYDSLNRTYTTSPYNASDTGKIYYLGLQIPAADNYILMLTTDSASIFRNNGVAATNYPLGTKNILTYSSNSVASPSTTANYANFFYFFYNVQVSTTDAESKANNIQVNAIQKPTITQNSDSTLVSSIGTNYQWFVFDSLLVNQTDQTLKATKNAMYKVSTTVNGCTLTSDPKLIMITAINEAPVNEIGLRITSTDFISNLIKGNSFFIQFSNIQNQDISLDLLNAMGERVFHKDKISNLTVAQRIDINTLNTGVYFVKIYANKKVYTQRVFVTNN